MSIPNFLCDKVCSTCGVARFKVISDAVTLHNAPVQKEEVLQCMGCGACKASGMTEDEKHSTYHETGSDPNGKGYTFNGSGFA